MAGYSSYNPYQLPDVPNTPYRPWKGSKGEDLSFGRTVTQQTGMSSGGIPNLIDYIMEDAQRNRDATRQSRQQAIDTYNLRGPQDAEVFGKYNKAIDDEISRQLNDPNTLALKTNLSNIINKPDMFSQDQIYGFEHNINAQADRNYEALASKIGTPFNSGQRGVNLANARAASLSDASNNMLGFKRQLASDTSARQLSAADILSNLTGQGNSSVGSLLGLKTGLGQTDAQLSAARTQAIADLLGGTIYNPNDLTGLLDTLMSARAGMKASKKGTTNALIGAAGSIGGSALGGLLGNTSLFK